MHETRQEGLHRLCYRTFDRGATSTRGIPMWVMSDRASKGAMGAGHEQMCGGPRSEKTDMGARQQRANAVVVAGGGDGGGE